MNHLLLLLFFCFIFNINAQTDDVSEYLYPSQLKKNQEETWKSIEKKWYDTIYFNYIETKKIKLSDCYKCGELYIDVEAIIDVEGNFTYDAERAKNCGVEMTLKLQKLLMNYFVSQKFPKNLRNLKVKTRFGILYKC